MLWIVSTERVRRNSAVPGVRRLQHSSGANGGVPVMQVHDLRREAHALAAHERRVRERRGSAGAHRDRWCRCWRAHTGPGSRSDRHRASCRAAARRSPRSGNGACRARADRFCRPLDRMEFECLRVNRRCRSGMNSRMSWPAACRYLSSAPDTSARPPVFANGATSALMQADLQRHRAYSRARGRVDALLDCCRLCAMQHKTPGRATAAYPCQPCRDALNLLIRIKNVSNGSGAGLPRW